MIKKIFPLFLFLIFNSCKKEDGQEPYILENSNLLTKITLEVYGFDNLNGDLAVAVNNSSTQFNSNTNTYIDTIILVTSNKITLVFDDVAVGNYAISVFHDEDSDGELDVGSFLGIPEEGFGFSNNPAIGFSQPDFNDCKFVVEEHQNVIVPISLVYL